MTSQDQLLSLYDSYIAQYPDEVGRIAIFYDFINKYTGSELYDRKNFEAHITTSAFIIDKLGKHMLMLEHKTLKRWLQPGGHYELTDADLLASSLREAVEETGIPTDELLYLPILADTIVPFDIDPHHIPENTKKQEPSHFHLDVRYVFRYTGIGSFDYNADESTGMKWVSFDELEKDATFGNVITKIKGLLNN